MMRERLQAMDKDGDGKVSKDEFRGDPALFDLLPRRCLRGRMLGRRV